MRVYYSPSSSGFFHEGIQPSLPNDCIEITDQLYEELMNGISSGHYIFVDDFGELSLLIKEATLPNGFDDKELWLNTELVRIRDELEKVQDSDPMSIGTVADWRNYRKSVRAWAENSFISPKPTAPDFKE